MKAEDKKGVNDMGNYYKRRRFAFDRRKRGGKLVFVVGAALVLVLTLVWFGRGGELKSAFLEERDHFVSLAKEAWTWGSESLTGKDLDLSVPVSSGVVVENFGIVADAEGNDVYHNGIDIKVPADSEVLAAADGSVADLSEHDDGTVWVTVSHAQHWSTVYGRLGEVRVAVGDQINKGTVIGTVAAGILHFEVREDEVEKDPVRYFNGGETP